MALPNRDLEADLLKALGHPARLQIVEILAKQETCVCELIPQLGLEQSNLSQHLKLLRKHGLVESRREGSKVIYRLTSHSLIPLVTAASDVVQEHLDRVSAVAASRR